jgi:hypothetical protein
VAIEPFPVPERGDLAILLAGRSMSGDGGAMALADLVLVQSRFLDADCPPAAACDVPCNTVVVLWQEDAPHPGGVDVHLDGLLLATVASSPRSPA